HAVVETVSVQQPAASRTTARKPEPGGAEQEPPEEPDEQEIRPAPAASRQNPVARSGPSDAGGRVPGTCASQDRTADRIAVRPGQDTIRSVERGPPSSIVIHSD